MIYILSWYLLGLVGCGCILYHDYLTGDNLTVKEIGEALVLSCLGLIIFILLMVMI